MKMKLILLFIIATITIISEGCKKPPIQPGNNGGTGNGNGSGTGNPTNNKPPEDNSK